MNTRLLHMAAPDDNWIECPKCGDPLRPGELCGCDIEVHSSRCGCPDCTAGDYDPERDVFYPSRA